ncbi:hypothetical protein CMQ_2058 [Grosmannia clavigera kw1407]|uniref:Prefoldin subunit n=1 Tax=Grosmannia clavigera (strain kw1407 / UAMH 11150) TaxID=655863 RepID=F0XN90_GROCL|nr:uncharacterized protein CMQ_2058 [Grosmannia clavigera kw1407]EFX00977.1 hypothetical protein CMQ_2058 [Grosmannia clavigera kw1407]
MLVSRIIRHRDAVRLGPELGLGLNHISHFHAGYSKTLRHSAAAEPKKSSGTTVGWRRHRRFPKYLRDSPSGTFALRLRSRTTPLTFRAWQRFDEAARSRSLRLPIVTLQMMIRKDEAQMKTSLSQSLCDDGQWRTRLNSLAFKGISEGDIQHWVWIMEGKDADERIERFVSVDRPKPIFLLFQLLRHDQRFQKGSSLQSIYDYVYRHHVRSKASPPDAALPFGAVRRTLDPGLNMTRWNFATLFRLLVYHYLRVWPSALPALAKLVCLYVEITQQVAKNGRKAYSDACSIFNYALVMFQRKSPVQPVFQMRYNWRAQKIMLAMSTTLPRPLLINRSGFRAIRRVMLALGKSPAERRVALRMMRTWPPYRRDWDGLDEKREPADDFSRSVKAGVLMHEAGYSEMEHDRALSVLGGVLPGEAPTVQTRSLSPRTWTGRQANLNVFSTWAARVKATRDINEAWHEFQTSPTEGLQPSVQVYTEMFKKLVAIPVNQLPDPAHALLPGDAREVFPVNDATLTTFEKQRLRPPTVEGLYSQMLHNGTRPVGDCLSVLIQHAPSMQAAMRYLHDSPLDKAAISALQLPHVPSADSSTISRHRRRDAAAGPTLEVLQQIPLGNLGAYIFLMCRFQPRLAAEPARLGKMRRAGLIHHAINICAQRLRPTLDDGQTYKAPWHTIMQTLAQPKLLVSAENTQDRRFHDREALGLALRVFGLVKMGGGVDVVVLDGLCKATQKCLRWTDMGLTTDGGGDLQPLLRMAHATIVSAFSEMAGGSPASQHHPATRHNFTAGSLQSYMQTLGYMGDVDGMVQAVGWILRMWEDETVLEDAKDVLNGQYSTIGRVLVMFRAFAETQVTGSVLEQLERQMGALQERKYCTWRWPTQEDADAFVRWHRQEHNAAFWSRVRPGV